MPKPTATFKLKRGMDIPIAGAPEQVIHEASSVSRVALVGYDTIGVKRLPSLEVQPGDRVKRGQPLFRGKSFTEVVGTSPASGVVEAVHRGPKRVVETVVIKVDDGEAETFNRYSDEEIAGLNGDQVRENLLASGIWLSMRTRPFGMVPDPNREPDALFISAMNTRPLAADPAVVIDQARADFERGVLVLSKLTSGTTWVTHAPGADIPVPDAPTVKTATFEGPHPAGLVGTHIHFLHPVSIDRQVWHVGYQAVIAVGRLFATGDINPERIIAIGGPMAANPRLVRTVMGASTNELLKDEIKPGGDVRVVSGSILGGRQAVGTTAFLGRYHYQLALLEETMEREFMGWLAPGAHKVSKTRSFLRSLLGGGPENMNTAYNGSPRALVPLGMFEEVVPLDILPTQLIRALIVDDTEAAEALGALELDEEDLSLCSFVDNGKHDFGPILRRNLHAIWHENQ
ncbi:MAG: Na(+)-translocating NADH-quinone reductase subunit A [Gammaproteobacteria bacterium]